MTPDDTRRRLADLASQAANAKRSDHAIRAHAAEQLAKCNERLDELRPLAPQSEDAAREYSDLVVERGRLNRILAEAN